MDEKRTHWRRAMFVVERGVRLIALAAIVCLIVAMSYGLYFAISMRVGWIEPF